MGVKVSVLLGNGDGTFQPRVEYPSTTLQSLLTWRWQTLTGTEYRMWPW